MKKNDFIIVTPVYEDADVAQKLFIEISREYGEDVYIVAIDDGSLNSIVNAETISRSNLNGVVVNLKRNVGHQKAIAIGLSYVSEHLNGSQYVVVMDSDGEDVPSSILPLIEEIKGGNVDVVVAKRKNRVETLKFRSFYLMYKFVFRVLSGRVINFGNFMALRSSAINRLVVMQELWMHVAGCVLLSKLKISYCELDRGPRYSGKSKMNFISLVLHGFKGLMIFSEDVLVRVGIACILIASISIIAVIIAVLLKTLGFATPGWFSVVLGILVLVFLQTGMLTLMSLMLTGVAKGGMPSEFNYNQLIKNIIHVKK